MSFFDLPLLPDENDEDKLLWIFIKHKKTHFFFFIFSFLFICSSNFQFCSSCQTGRFLIRSYNFLSISLTSLLFTHFNKISLSQPHFITLNILLFSKYGSIKLKKLSIAKYFIIILYLQTKMANRNAFIQSLFLKSLI